MKNQGNIFRIVSTLLLASFILTGDPAANAVTPSQYQAMPVIGATAPPPLVMLVLGRNHKLYYEAYNDASDLNEDGVLDVGYNPEIDYYGYFDCYKVYTYNSGSDRFEPLRTTADKKVNSAATTEWSGDYLNYLTMSRMDAIRKVLYGGYRSTDTATETVLERAYIPQDAHTWGKEYESVERDGFDIRDYTPLDLPDGGTRHLFASTSLTDPSDAAYKPLLRVMPHNPHRIWEWVSKERPVADGSLTTTGGAYNQHPDNQEEYDDMVDMFANAAHLQGSSPATQINGSGNPHGDDDDYMTIFTGNITITTAGDYEFAVDGDDALEFYIDGVVVAAWYASHGKCTCTDHSGTITLTAGTHAIEYRHEEDGGGDNYYLHWKGPDSGGGWQIVPTSAFSELTQTNYALTTNSSTITDYVVRIKVGDSTMPETNCKRYKHETTSATVFKPIGLLQRYGEPERMYFGLISGSYTKNTSGGVLRRNISDIKDEVDSNTGQFTAVNGIIQSMNKLRVIDFRYSDHSYNASCGWVATRAINEGECRMWGNPVGEMMYETLRYFAGKDDPTEAFTYGTDAGLDDNELGLPNEEWADPYATYPYCSKPFMLVLSDINPTYDSDQLPGSYFSGITGDLTGLDVEDLADTIGLTEGETGEYYIGHQGGTVDGACTPKTITSGLGKSRGLCPEEPTKQGSYYGASVAYYGRMNDISTALDNQFVDTFAVGLASPLPRIEITVGEKRITLVPFAKSVGGYSISATEGNFQPTNTIVDFYVDTITATYGKFRINYEDVEQGADHDMDAITIYEFQVVDGAGNAVEDPALGVSVDITLTSEYAAGSIIQHSGYIISGTSQDGTYLEVRDVDTGAGSDPDYFLDTPAGELPGGNWDDDTALPIVSAPRRFTPNSGGDAPPAELLKNPLWYAGKWGGFEDQNGNDLPDLDSEWDKNSDGIPDNYFYVTNPLRLEEQLNATFAQIAAKSSSGTSSQVLATTNEGEGTLIQAYFRPVTATEADEVRWMGFLQSLWVDDNGLIREDTNGNLKLDMAEDKVLVFKLIDGETKVQRYDVSEENPSPDTETESYNTVEMENISPLWEAGRVLADTDPSDRNILTSPTGAKDNLIEFSESNLASIKCMLGVSADDILSFPDANISLLGADLDSRAQSLIQYIRGTDHVDLRNRTIGGKVWKLGDIVYSTPISVSKPVERYHVIYSDPTYGNYVSAQNNRQTVVYVGANDGMLHAFTSWWYNPSTKTLEDPAIGRGNQGDTIGDELWSYIPRSVLPHLKWLSDPQYSHTYYVDLTPHVFDAKIAGPTQDDWGTFLMVGLNMGGKDIPVDPDCGGPLTTETVKPSYTLIDITDPVDPKLIWERSYAGLGMTRSAPCIIKTGGDNYETPVANEKLEYSGRPEQWIAVFGSGPQGNYAYNGISDQPGRVYVIDLKTGDPMGGGATDYLFTLSDNSVVNSPTSLDKGLNYEVNTIYLGESIKANPVDITSTWTGKAWTIDTYLNWTDTNPSGNIDPDWWTVTNSPAAWHLHLLVEEFVDEEESLVDLGPITAPMALSTDRYDNVWIYFGTGRYISEQDKTDTTQQHLFGIKDPLFNHARDYVFAGTLPGSPAPGVQGIDKAKLLPASLYRVASHGRTVEKLDGETWSNFGYWRDLLALMRLDDKDDEDDVWLDGWSRNLAVSTDDPPLPSERNISKFSILGGAVFVPGYTPSEEVCLFGGTSNLFGLYYETGTTYYRTIFNCPCGTYVEPSISLGEGAPPPITGFHAGREKGAKAFLQMSTGEIIQADVDTPLKFKSRMMDWID